MRRATLAHLLLAGGVLCALFSVLAVFDQAWEYAYGWLGLALLLQAVDPAMVVRAEPGVAAFASIPATDSRAASAVAFLNTVFVPIIAMLHAGFLDGIGGIAVASVALLAALYRLTFHAPAAPSATEFLGLPAIWSVVGFYLHAFDATPLVAVAAIGLGIVLGLVPYRWPHPLWSGRWSLPTRFVTAVWVITAAVTLWNGLPASATAKGVFLVTAFYGMALAVLMARENG